MKEEYIEFLLRYTKEIRKKARHRVNMLIDKKLKDVINLILSLESPYCFSYKEERNKYIIDLLEELNIDECFPYKGKNLPESKNENKNESENENEEEEDKISFYN